MLAVYPWTAARYLCKVASGPPRGMLRIRYVCSPSPQTCEREGLQSWRSKGLKCCENKTLPSLCLGLPTWDSHGVHKEESTGPILVFLHKRRVLLIKKVKLERHKVISRTTSLESQDCTVCVKEHSYFSLILAQDPIPNKTMI